MTLRVERGPRGGIAQLVKFLADKPRSKATTSNHRIKIAKPIPLWRIIESGHDSSSFAQQFGWRYLILDSKELLWIDLNRDKKQIYFGSQMTGGDTDSLRLFLGTLNQTELELYDSIYNVRILYTGFSRQWGVWISPEDDKEPSYFADINSVGNLRRINIQDLPPTSRNGHEIERLPSRLSA